MSHTPGNGRPRPTPLARRMAAAHGLDLGGLIGSGIGGRVTSRDVATCLSQPPAPDSAPTAWMLIEVDLTDLLALLAQPAAAVSPLALLAAVAHATALALREHPHINAAWDGDAILRYGRVNLAVRLVSGGAVTLPDAGDTPLAALTQALAHGDWSAATAPTFTIIEAAISDAPSLARVPLPAGQAACLIVSPPRRRLVANDDQLAIRWLASLALVFDHRVIDGAPAGRFLQTIRRRLERSRVIAA